jgi:hypothetical protein
MQVFLSVGRVATPEQKTFLDKLEDKLRKRGVEPRTLGRNTFTSGQPLDKIKEEMRKSRGLLVLAFERLRFPSGGTELRLGESAASLPERCYATPWHHIELAMASILGLPTFVLLERSVHQEGLLEEKYGWYVHRVTLDPSALDADEFTGILDDWCKRVASTVTAKIDVGDLSVRELVVNMRPAQVRAALVALVTILGGAFGLGAWMDAKGLLSGPSMPVNPASSQARPLPSVTATSAEVAALVTPTAPAPLPAPTASQGPSTSPSPSLAAPSHSSVPHQRPSSPSCATWSGDHCTKCSFSLSALGAISARGQGTFDCSAMRPGAAVRARTSNASAGVSTAGCTGNRIDFGAHLDVSGKACGQNPGCSFPATWREPRPVPFRVEAATSVPSDGVVTATVGVDYCACDGRDPATCSVTGDLSIEEVH